MKYRLCILIIAIASTFMQAQAVSSEVLPKIGAVYEIGSPVATMFKHIRFPRPNFIIKRGGIVNYSKAETVAVTITSVKERKDGSTRVFLKRTDGKRFFGSHVFVSADFQRALQSGELR